MLILAMTGLLSDTYSMDLHLEEARVEVVRICHNDIKKVN
jgi:hypothetical protein